MENLKISWTKDEFIAYLLIYAAQANQIETIEEKEFIKSRFQAPLLQKIYKEINIEEPGEIRYFSPLKNILKQRREWEELIQFTKAYADVNINDPKALIDLGEVYIWAGEIDMARKIFDPILKKGKNNPNIIKMIISKYAQNGSFDESEKILKESRIFLEMPAFYSMEIARFYSNRMAYDKALSEYILYVSKNPSRLDFVSDRVVGFLSSPDVASILIKSLKKESFIKTSFLKFCRFSKCIIRGL